MAGLFGIPDGAEEVPLWFIFSVGTYAGAVLAHIDIDEVTGVSGVVLMLGGKIGELVLLMEIAMLPEELTVGRTPDVVFVVTFDNPPIRMAPMVK